MHTRIVHCVANLRSLHNIIYDRSRRLLLSAVSSSLILVKQYIMILPPVAFPSVDLTPCSAHVI